MDDIWHGTFLGAGGIPTTILLVTHVSLPHEASASWGFLEVDPIKECFDTVHKNGRHFPNITHPLEVSNHWILGALNFKITHRDMIRATRPGMWCPYISFDGIQQTVSRPGCVTESYHLQLDSCVTAACKPRSTGSWLGKQVLSMDRRTNGPLCWHNGEWLEKHHF